MRPEESFIGQSVRSLQTMLRVIAQDAKRQSSVIPDGIYGANTTAAVSDFQRRNGLAVTGIADEPTWNAIVAAYEPALIKVDQPQCIQVLLEPGEVIVFGQQHPELYLAQAILTVLSQQYGSITAPGFSGTLDTPTAQSLRSFQALHNLPQSGELDRLTWHALALHYPMASTLRKQSAESLPAF